MKKIYLLFVIVWLVPVYLLAQETEEAKTDINPNKSLLGYWVAKSDIPVMAPFESGYFIDNQTTRIQSKKTLEIEIQHRFGTMKNGVSDFWGIFGSANTRLGMNYTITDWLQVGIGTTKDYKLQDLGLKVNILQQSRANKVPLSIGYYGVWAVDARDEENFGKNYKFTDRFTFFNELMLSRKFFEWMTLQAGVSFSHFNKVDSTMDHDLVGLHFLGRFRVTAQSSVIINYDLPLQIKGISEHTSFTNASKPNLGLGWEISTSTHCFQIFFGTANYLIPQYNMMLNRNDWTDGEFMIGFNITRLWSF